jgi:YHS domain-containing protein
MRYKHGLDVTFGTYGLGEYREHLPVHTKDPVCGATLDEATAPYKSGYAGEMFYFCSVDCQMRFHDHLGKYLRKPKV